MFLKSMLSSTFAIFSFTTVAAHVITLPAPVVEIHPPISTPSMPNMDWLHDNNRIVAFGTSYLVQNGENVANWKTMHAEEMQLCTGGSIPTPLPAAHGLGLSSEPTDTVCTVIVNYYVTKAYQYLECDNGLAYINQSGVGVTLTSKTTGVPFEWSSNMSCSDDIFSSDDSGTTPVPPSTHPKAFRDLVVRRPLK